MPIAFVVLKQQMTEEELMDFCKEQLASYKLPKQIHFVNELPRNGSNKLIRRKLKEHIIKEGLVDKCDARIFIFIVQVLFLTFPYFFPLT